MSAAESVNASAAIYIFFGLVLCLGIVTFEQGVACLTGSYSISMVIQGAPMLPQQEIKT
jgi:hypothetical protein